jgi:DNA invertase Pin-like site-specific DNA recombinase
MPRAETPRKRCAIYTRKSSEEGLEQEFNSLHAQREASEAYILSQRHEGWVVVPTAYDDGGFSGGNLERPGLHHLLADVRAGRIDVIVTYKVDRLTRSLADFARLIEIFDAHHVSFVSVTQQFNTTTSMGRLTLNVLLSFAQFEREVTGERIRDKIAASKKKGMWMGGNPPLGYDAHERKLIVTPAEAETVRSIFALYLKLGCVRRLKETLDRRRWTTKRFMTAAGRIQGGRPFSRGHLYRILSNPLYLGRIAHKGQLHPGQHEALIEPETWEAVQAQLASNTAGHRRRAGAIAPSLLAGLLVDSAGERLTPSHAVKNGRRYRYYISRALIAEAGRECKQGSRLPAHDLEQAVIGATAGALSNRGLLIQQVGMIHGTAEQITALLDTAGRIAAKLDKGTLAEQVQALRNVIERIIIGDDTLAITLRRAALMSDAKPATDQNDAAIQLLVPLQLRRRGVEIKLVIPGEAHRTQPARPDPALIKAVARGHLWFEDLVTGKAASLREIAEQEGITEGYVGRLIRLAFLAPCMVEAILEGTQPVDLTAARLTGRISLPLNWTEQHQLIYG